MPIIQSTLQGFGGFKSLTFSGVAPTGENRYDAVFANTTQELKILMRPDGLIDGVQLDPR